jgi:hypothetical protein
MTRWRLFDSVQLRWWSLTDPEKQAVITANKLAGFLTVAVSLLLTVLT